MTRYRTLAVLLLLLLTLPLSGCDLVGTDDNDSAVVTDGAYVANQGNFSDGNGSVTLYDPDSQASTEAVGNLSSIVQSIALRSDRLYLTANSGGRLDVFDADDQSPLRQLTGLSGPRYLTLPDDDTAFLTSQQSFGSSDPDSVHVLDANGSSVEVTESLAVPGTVEGVTHTGSRVYAALGGFMLALEHALFPRLGFNILMPVFGAALVGGIGNPYGAMLGALVIGLAENIILGTNFGALLGLGGLFDVGEVLVPTGYKPAVSFIIIILVLLFRPVGLLGRR